MLNAETLPMVKIAKCWYIFFLICLLVYLRFYRDVSPWKNELKLNSDKYERPLHKFIMANITQSNILINLIILFVKYYCTTVIFESGVSSSPLYI